MFFSAFIWSNLVWRFIFEQNSIENWGENFSLHFINFFIPITRFGSNWGKEDDMCQKDIENKNRSLEDVSGITRELKTEIFRHKIYFDKQKILEVKDRADYFKNIFCLFIKYWVRWRQCQHKNNSKKYIVFPPGDVYIIFAQYIIPFFECFDSL